METVSGKRLHEYIYKDDEYVCKWCGKNFYDLLDILYINFHEEYTNANQNYKLKEAINEYYPCIFVSDDERAIRDIIE